MGEIAEMMLNGTLDFETGEYLGKGDGFPRTLGDKYHEPTFPRGYMGGRKAKDTPCGICGKFMRGQLGLETHMKAKHKGKDMQNDDKNPEKKQLPNAAWAGIRCNEPLFRVFLKENLQGSDLSADAIEEFGGVRDKDQAAVALRHLMAVESRRELNEGEGAKRWTKFAAEYEVWKDG